MVTTASVVLTPHEAVARAAAHPDRLAYYLRAYDLKSLCDRLCCDGDTALRLQLYAVPDAYEWRQSVRTIARRLGLAADALDILLREAMRVGR